MATQSLPTFLSASSFTVTEGGVVQTGVSTVLVTADLPTQALPPYLSASTFTQTIGGVETVGVTTIGLPLTYFGPSIPLGTAWTFGGSTSPASLTQTSPTATATPSSSSSSLSSPSTGSASSAASSSTSSVSSTPSSSQSSSSATSSPSNGSTTSAASTASPTSSSNPFSGSAGSKHLSGGQLAGIIIAAVIVAVVALMLVTLFCVRFRRRRAAYQHPNVSDFVIVDSEGGERFAGEGVPRSTGEEEDPFLERDSDATAAMREVEPSARLVSPRSRSVSMRTTGTQIPPEGVVPTALKSTPSPPRTGPKVASPFFHASASSLFFNPARGPDQSLAGAATAGALKRDSGSTGNSNMSKEPVTMGGKIIPQRELMQMDDQWRQEATQGSSGAMGISGSSEMGERLDLARSSLSPPPAAANAETGPSNASRQSYRSHLESPASEEDESATLLTAHRFNVGEGGRTVIVNKNGDESGPTSWQAVGLGGLTRLSRLSWFQRLEQNRASSPNTPTARRGSRSPLPAAGSVGAGSSLLTAPRPVSDLTASSTGDTEFFDAPSSNPSTASSRSGNGEGEQERPASMPQIPSRAALSHTRAASNAASGSPAPGSESGSVLDQPALLMLYPPVAQLSNEPASEPEPRSPTPEESQSVRLIDVLDTPAPAPVAISPFSTSSTRGGPALPPGLEHLANIRAWQDSGSDTMPSSATFGTGSINDIGIDIVGEADTLEDEPPRPREGWMLLRSATMTTNGTSSAPLWRVSGMSGSRLHQKSDTTRFFEKPEEIDIGHDVRSVMGSLHSIPDGLRPVSPAGSGSGSRSHYNSSSLGSGESRMSRGRDAHNTRGTNSSQSQSGSGLSHSNSVTSEGRRRPRREPGEPLLTPEGSLDFGTRARLSAIGGHRASPFGTPQRSPQPGVSFVGVRPGTAGSGSLLGRTN